MPEFHEQPFPHRLHRILLRTSGQFKCGDDRDRLFSVLGIAEGATTGNVSMMANLVETVSNPATHLVIFKQMDLLWNTSTILIKTAILFFSFAYSSWREYYDVKAKHWAINRPNYHIAGYIKVVNTIAGKAGEGLSRVDFFTAIAGYLAKETGILSFLDVANCGEDKDAAMPSWVPNWSREINKPAYDFASRAKNKQAAGKFVFTEGGKTLHLAGKSMGTVNVMSPTDLDMLELSPGQGVFEKMLALPDNMKSIVALCSQTISDMLSESSFSMLNKTEKNLMSVNFSTIRTCLEFGLHLLREGDATMVYSHDGITREMGFLRAGDATKGDRLVYVPGCFHYLLLRRSRRTAENSIRWKLVGLVEMGTGLTQAGGSGETESTRFPKNMALYNYTIE